MKKNIIIYAVALILAVFCTSCSKNTEDVTPDGMKKASSDELAGYSFYVPQDWTVDMQTAATRAYCSKSDISSVSVMAWELEYTDSTVSDWWDVNVKELQQVFPDYSEESIDQTTLDGSQAVRYVYTASSGANKFKFMQTAAVKDGAVYVVTYSALEDVYDSHTEEVYTMLENFRFD